MSSSLFEDWRRRGKKDSDILRNGERRGHFDVRVVPDVDWTWSGLALRTRPSLPEQGHSWDEAIADPQILESRPSTLLLAGNASAYMRSDQRTYWMSFAYVCSWQGSVWSFAGKIEGKARLTRTKPQTRSLTAGNCLPSSNKSVCMIKP